MRSQCSVTLNGKLDDAAPSRTPTVPLSVALPSGRLGLTLRPPSADELRDSGEAMGLYIDKLSPAAERAGVQVGDRLLAINAEPVKTVDQARQLAERPGKSVALLLLRERSRVYVPLRLG